MPQLQGSHWLLDAEVTTEHTADARAFPGKHPNIDRLVDIEAGRLAPLTVRLQPAAAA